MSTNLEQSSTAVHHAPPRVRAVTAWELIAITLRYYRKLILLGYGVISVVGALILAIVVLVEGREIRAAGRVYDRHLHLTPGLDTRWTRPAGSASCVWAVRCSGHPAPGSPIRALRQLGPADPASASYRLDSTVTRSRQSTRGSSARLLDPLRSLIRAVLMQN